MTQRNKALGNLEILGLLTLWLDDGSMKLHDGNGKISTMGFSRNENLVIINFLGRKFGIEGKLTNENEIFLNSRVLPNFLNIIYPAFKQYGLPNCMRYKMGFLDPTNSTLIERYKERRQAQDREGRRRRMSNDEYRERANKIRRLAQKRRLDNPEYRKKTNEYAKIWQREKRARDWLLKHGTKK